MQRKNTDNSAIRSSSAPLIKIFRETVIIYRGSFDPPHQGHRDIVEYCLTYDNVAKVYIVANEANKYKPNRTDYATRKHMMQLVFEGLDVEYVEDTMPDVIKKLRSHNPCVNIIGVVGVDGVEIGVKKPTVFTELDINHWLVVPRASQSTTLPSDIGGKRLTYLTPANFSRIDLSSTAIRRHLATHDEFYSGAPLPDNVGVSKPLENYLREHSVYRDYRQAIRAHLASHHITLPTDVDLSTLENATGMCGGYSGDLLYIAKNKQGSPALVIKVFLGNQREQHYQHEIVATQQLTQLHLTLSAPIPHLTTSSDDNRSFIVMPVAPGVKLSHYLDAVKKSADDPAEQKIKIEELKRSIRLFAQSLAELHTAKPRMIERVSENALTYFLAKIDSISTNLLSKTTDLSFHADQFKKHITEIRQNMLSQPAVHTYTHGDPNLNNFFIDMNNHRVTFLDNGHLVGKWCDPTHLPTGFAENEYYETLSWMMLIGHRMQLDENILREIQETFSEAYLANSSSDFTSTPAAKFFKLFWMLRTINIPLREWDNDTGRKEYPVTSLHLLNDLILALKNDLAGPLSTGKIASFQR